MGEKARIFGLFSILSYSKVILYRSDPIFIYNQNHIDIPKLFLSNPFSMVQTQSNLKFLPSHFKVLFKKKWLGGKYASVGSKQLILPFNKEQLDNVRKKSNLKPKTNEFTSINHYSPFIMAIGETICTLNLLLVEMYIKAIKIVNCALCKTTSFKAINSFDFVTANSFLEGYVILM